MMEQISPEVQDDGIKNTKGKPIAGGYLFRKYLLNRCQEEFERGWFAKEAELYSDEYYAAQKAKRQGLGLIEFLGELFKLQMLTERIMHECVKKLLGNVENHEEKEIESLCLLLKTAGQLLDTPKARAHMDVYFTRMKELGKSLNVSSRMQFMLQDVIELRERKWVSRNAVAAPTTIAAVHELAAKEKAAAEKESYNRQISSQFGKINKGAPMAMVMGPSSVFAGGKKDNKRERTNSSSNMFYMLSQNPELAPETSAKPSRPSSRKPSVDLDHAGAPESAILRRKLQLLPRFNPAARALTAMSEADAKKKIDEDVKEFFAVRNLEEADVYFTGLPREHRFRLVDKLVASALESKEADVRLAGDFFTQAMNNGQCTLEVFEEGFMPMAEFLDDIAIDAPMAFNYMAIMLRGAGFEKEPERLQRIASKLEDSDKLVSLVA
ncbi:armadillo-type protein [Suillus ampliporus]|nr:armadillo-type protein [Suillus ampliporus]